MRDASRTSSFGSGLQNHGSALKFKKTICGRPEIGGLWNGYNTTSSFIALVFTVDLPVGSIVPIPLQRRGGDGIPDCPGSWRHSVCSARFSIGSNRHTAERSAAHSSSRGGRTGDMVYGQDTKRIGCLGQ